MRVQERIRMARLAEHLSHQPEYAYKIGIAIENRKEHEYADRKNGKEVKCDE